MLRYFGRYFKRGEFGGLLETQGTFGDFEGLWETSGDLGTLEDVGRLWKTLEDVGRRGKTLGGFVNIWEIFGTIWDISYLFLPRGLIQYIILSTPFLTRFSFPLTNFSFLLLSPFSLSYFFSFFFPFVHSYLCLFCIVSFH